MRSLYWRPADKGISVDAGSKDMDALFSEFGHRLRRYDIERLRELDISDKVKLQLSEAIDKYGLIELFVLA